MASARNQIASRNPVAGKQGNIPDAPPLERPLSPLGGLLSLLVPGFGQIYQGRIAKGILFFACIYLMFFYGFAMGQGKNVFLRKTEHIQNPWNLNPFFADLYNRPQYAAQFWTGVVAWPALWQYYHSPDGKNNDQGGDVARDKETIFGSFQRAPSEKELNDLQRNTDKSWDLAWVMTVIAGVLNILVVYDAVAGPAFGHAPPKKEEDDQKKELAEDNKEKGSE